MKVMLINGSRRAEGCTHTALGLVAQELAAAGIQTEEIHVTDEDAVKRAVADFDGCDGLVLGSPVYYASPTGEIEMFLDRFYGSCKTLAGKPCAVIASARRAGTSATLDALAKYPTIAEMPLVSSCYWPMVHGNTPAEVMQDEEGVQIMRQLGRNMAWLLRCIEAGRTAGIERTPVDEKVRTNFIR